MFNKLKILIIGPKKSGKSSIANLLSDSQDTPSQNYRPTVGCSYASRILEFEKQSPTSGKYNIELWDVSGDPKFEKCWPAIQLDSQGVIFVYDPKNPTHFKEMETWVSKFPRAMNVQPHQCMAFANHQTSSFEKTTPPPCIAKHVATVDCSLENPTQIHVSFEKYFATLTKILSEKLEKEENTLLN